MPDIRMTDEIREQLYGVLPFSQDSSVEYIPQAFKDVPDDFRPVFILRSFTKPEENQVRRTLGRMKSDSDTVSIESQAQDTVRKCLLGWKNLWDVGSGQTVEYESDPSGGCSKTCFERLPSLIIVDLFLYIGKISGMMDIEKKGLRS